MVEVEIRLFEHLIWLRKLKKIIVIIITVVSLYRKHLFVNKVCQINVSMYNYLMSGSILRGSVPLDKSQNERNCKIFYRFY